MVLRCWAKAVRVEGPLALYAAGFGAHLLGQGYMPSSAEDQLRLMAHVSRWLAEQRMGPAALSAEVVERFLGLRPVGRRAVGPLLGYLGGLGLLPEPTVEVPTPVERLLVEYRGYLVRERGLVSGSVELRERVARLFLTKTAFTAVLGLAIAIPTATFPLLPRQFTLAATVTIGVPAFVLALAPSAGPWRPQRFLSSVVRFAIAAGVPIAVGIIAGYVVARYGLDIGLRHARTVSTGIVVTCGLAVVLQIESECGGRRRRIAVAGLCAVMALLFVLALVVPFLRHFYELASPTAEGIGAWAIGTTVGVGGMLGALRLFHDWAYESQEA